MYDSIFEVENLFSNLLYRIVLLFCFEFCAFIFESLGFLWNVFASFLRIC